MATPEKGTMNGRWGGCVCGAAFLVADGPNLYDLNVYIRPLQFDSNLLILALII
jgi:hypothetical protein